MQIHIQQVHGEGLSPVRAGLYLNNRVTAVSDDPSIPYDVKCEVGVLHGQPTCLSLEARQRPDGPPVTRRGLNSLPIDTIVRSVVAEVSMRAEPTEGGATKLSPLTAQESAALRRELTPRRGRASDPAHREQQIERAVQLYRELLAGGIKHPKPTIANQMNISPSYVGSLLSQARKAGLLGAVPAPGRAGEAGDE